MAQNLYGPGVRMGNWNEDIYLEEELMKDFLEKRGKGQLLIQRNRRLKENLLRPTQLSVSEDGYVHCGDKVMLVNPAHAEVGAHLFLGGDLSLCATPDEIKAHLSDELEVPCGLSAAQTRIPVGRNTFTILRADGNATGQVLRYGQDFCLATTGGFEDKMLYLSSDHRTLQKSSKRSLLQEAYLTDEVSYLSCWQAAFLDPQLRLEYEGAPVPANAKILIYHCRTNRGLAAHRHLFLSTYFGKEAEVAVHTHLDSHRVEKPSNRWMLVTGNPGKDSSTMLDLPKPLAEAPPALEQATDPGAQ
ncbi:cilia- and flagella-associated protein 161 [Herpailurus yagouaroundi]|uniref:cilia- and flagella-associated protein 161 n=1 Tax=Herpailurus yagouaroundi TaxID=1608482 RepID=UPI001AD6C99B|nr:cilia- and flagella-associated protein 161 [Puma yagouaroundi]XP_040349413.1 cilia- and flagella-associated protein 161 [Puma yagouaroundi]XP_040349414.1 cilia- and flagella-associated protein 161 [Puma yagouaroundi]